MLLVIGLMMVSVIETRINRRLMLSSVGYALKGLWGVEVKRLVESWAWKKVWLQAVV